MDHERTWYQNNELKLLYNKIAQKTEVAKEKHFQVFMIKVNLRN